MGLALKTLLGLVVIVTVAILVSPGHEVISTAQARVIPEPSSMALLASGLGWVALFRKGRKAK